MTKQAKFPQPCRRCRGTGQYVWGAIVNGVPQHSGPCFLCDGTGRITSCEQIRRFIRQSNVAAYLRGGM